MKAPNDQYEMILAPFSDGVANSNVLYLATATTHATTALPSGWSGRMVRVTAHTVDAYLLFGSVSTLEVDGSLTASSPKLGRRLVAGTSEDFWLPRDTTHVSVESVSATGVVTVQLLTPAGTAVTP
jgi:hypothetical protein